MTNRNAAITFDHYVPKFVLRRFGYRKKKSYYVNVFDKKTSKKFKTNINDIMGENDFNAIRIGQMKASIEPTTAQIDSQAAPIIEQIINRKGTRELEPQSLAALFVFIALQINRGTVAREMHDDAMRQVREKLGRSVGPENVPEELFPIATPLENKIFHLRCTVDNIGEVAQSLSRLHPVVYECDSKSGFILGDGLISFHNSQPTNGLFGNLGIMCKGIEIYMPLTPNLSLGLLCPSIIDTMLDGQARAKSTAAKLDALKLLMIGPQAEQLRQNRIIFDEAFAHIQMTSEALTSGSPVPVKNQNVLHQNSLQVRYAERYLISYNGSFHPAEEMIRDHNNFTAGPRMIVS